jgi:hypothetical protein
MDVPLWLPGLFMMTISPGLKAGRSLNLFNIDQEALGVD